MTVSRLDIALDRMGLVLPEGGDIVVYRAQSAFDYSALPNDRLRLVNSFRPEFDRLSQIATTSARPETDDHAATLVHITRSKPETLGLIAVALARTRVGGVVIVDGARTDGIDSVLKQCKTLLPPEGVVVKQHGRLFWMRRPETLPAQIEKWPEALIPAKNHDGFLTAAGMFSPARADPGSTLLASFFDPRLKGRVADLGAGWGWLAAQALKLDTVTEIDLFEAEETALMAARENITDPRATFHWADVTGLADVAQYDAIIANPPFHQGRAATPALGLQFIAKAASLLKPKGNLWLVANRQLPYEAGLDAAFAKWTVLDETQYFKAILAARPRSQKARKYHAPAPNERRAKKG